MAGISLVKMLPQLSYTSISPLYRCAFCLVGSISKKCTLKKACSDHFGTHPCDFFGGTSWFFLGPEIPVGCSTFLRKIPSQEEAERLAQLRAAKVAQANASKKAEEKAKEWSKGWCKGLEIV